MSSYSDRAIGPDGRLRSYAEITEAQTRLQEAARRARVLHDAEIERNKTPLQKSIDLARSMLLEAKNNNDRKAKEQWQDRLDVLIDEQAQVREAAEKKAAFGKDAGVARIKESARNIIEKGEAALPGSSQVDRESLAALAMNADVFPTPAAAVAEYDSLLDRLESEALDRLRAQTPELGTAAIDAALAHGKVQLQIAELELARTKRQAGVSDVA